MRVLITVSLWVAYKRCIKMLRRPVMSYVYLQDSSRRVHYTRCAHVRARALSDLVELYARTRVQFTVAESRLENLHR